MRQRRSSSEGGARHGGSGASPTKAPFEMLERNWRRVASTHTLQVTHAGAGWWHLPQLRLQQQQLDHRHADQGLSTSDTGHPAADLQAPHSCCQLDLRVPQDLLDADKPAQAPQQPNLKLLALGCDRLLCCSQQRGDLIAQHPAPGTAAAQGSMLAVPLKSFLRAPCTGCC